MNTSTCIIIFLLFCKQNTVLTLRLTWNKYFCLVLQMDTHCGQHQGVPAQFTMQEVEWGAENTPQQPSGIEKAFIEWQ